MSCEHYPHVLIGLRPSDHTPFAVCQQCGDTGEPTERSEQSYGHIEWDGKPFDRFSHIRAACAEFRRAHIDRDDPQIIPNCGHFEAIEVAAASPAASEEQAR